MPKKTKRAKLLADARRRSQSRPAAAPPDNQTDQASAAPDQTRNVYVFSGVRQPQPTSHKPHADVNPDDEREFTAIRKDLIRTVIMAGTAFLVEIGLYWRYGRL